MFRRPFQDVQAELESRRRPRLDMSILPPIELPPPVHESMLPTHDAMVDGDVRPEDDVGPSWSSLFGEARPEGGRPEEDSGASWPSLSGEARPEGDMPPPSDQVNTDSGSVMFPPPAETDMEDCMDVGLEDGAESPTWFMTLASCGCRTQ